MHEAPQQESAPKSSKSEKLLDAVVAASKPLPPVEAPGGETAFFVLEFAEVARAHRFLSQFDAGKAQELFAKKSDTQSLLDDDASLRLAKYINAVCDLYRPAVVQRVLQAFRAHDLPTVFAVLATHGNSEFARVLALQDDVAKTRDIIVPLAIADHIERGVGIEEMDACLRSLGVVKEGSGHTAKDRVARVAGEWIVEQTRVMDVDEQDFKINSQLQAKLPDKADEAMCSAFETSLGKSDLQKFIRVIRATFRGDFSDDVLTAAEENYADLVKWKKSAEQQLEQLAEHLPDEAKSLHVYNARFDRTRSIAPFTKILLGKMSKSLYAFVLSDLTAVEQGVRPTRTVWEKADELLKDAVDMYRAVHEKGVPEFRAFAEYLAEHAKEGEFHVGRDTKTTTYIASHAARWGTMTGEERHTLIRHSNISRPLLSSSPRVLLKQFLKQEGVNERMMGIDGGYQGTNPQKALMAMNPDITPKELNEQIKLFSADTAVHERQFDPETNYYHFVEWMEKLPKFTDRMQHLEMKEVKGMVKFLGATKSRPPAEQLLAWVVQHAVWRGTIPKKLLEPEERVGEHALKQQKSFAQILREYDNRKE